MEEKTHVSFLNKLSNDQIGNSLILSLHYFK